ncbi:hypothetical protein G4H71_04950 [Rhodococcus triatomae]|nr:hypothetical protein [Rhodococcus triatomae]QNG17863.1 hypothetical protein G4H72_03095 [Rhodococcus triatomae]QNG22469.1 hypothetical protein G4H71_04950 [Rhodococcus triatomae]
MIVGLDVGADRAIDVIGTLAHDLCARGIVAPDTTNDWEFVPGPRAADVVDPEWAAIQGFRPNNVVRLDLGHQVFASNGNYEPPPCPTCDRAVEPDEHIRGIERWWATRIEPSLQCNGCGYHAAMGDWAHHFSLYVGCVGISFMNWPPLTDVFLTETGTRLSQRWRLIHSHI